jgi:hypothetical protein
MAVSNSTDFSLTALDIIEDARAEIGIHADEEPLAAHELKRGFRLLNRMLKAWQADGVMYWTATDGTLALVQSQLAYDFGAGGDFTTLPFDMMQVMISRSGSEIEMTEMSREDYKRLPIKTSEGYPTQWYYDRQRDSGVLYVWPAPDISAGTLNFTYRRSIMDMDVNADSMDLPQEWYRAVILGLAREMLRPYGKSGSPRAKEIIAEAMDAYATVKAFNTSEGEGSISILPYGMER